MSNVKVNGNTYNGVTSIKLMKADNSGYAEYKEGAEAADSLMETLISGGSLGDVVREDAAPCLEWMSGYTVGTISFPHATKIMGGCDKITAENVLLPNITTAQPVGAGKSGWRAYGFKNCKITGVLDLSKLETVMNNAIGFTTSEIGTLKLGSYAPCANIWNAAIITNFVWYGLTASAFGVVDSTGYNNWFTYFNGATITNLYVPAAVKEAFQAKITEGKLTKITNLYSIDEWED